MSFVRWLHHLSHSQKYKIRWQILGYGYEFQDFILDAPGIGVDEFY
jgi:hypothetical protein